MLNNLPVNAGKEGSISGSGRSPRGGNDNPLQFSCLGNLMHRRAWQATVHGVAKSRTKLSKLACTHAWLLLIISLVNSCDRLYGLQGLEYLLLSIPLWKKFADTKSRRTCEYAIPWVLACLKLFFYSFNNWSCMDVRVGLWRKLRAKELIL